MSAMVDTAGQVGVWLLLLRKYYQGTFCRYSEAEWQTLFKALERDAADAPPMLAQGFAALNASTAEERREFRFEFNRLFVGPEAPKAPPYESCYRNPERTLMGEETLRVRAFYREAGLEITPKNQQPDDFIAFELEFLGGLLDEGEEKQEQARQFLKKHLLVWCADHIREIRANSQQAVVLAMTQILEAVCATLQQAFLEEDA